MTIIQYQFYQTPMGTLLLVAEDEAICLSHFGANRRELLTMLSRTFSKASPKSSLSETSLPNNITQALDHYFKHGVLNKVFNTPNLGTEFRRAVWEGIKQIPPGSTQSYSELAQAIGHPRAVRAVASACAANPLAVLIPCHRVIRADRGLGGYRWGLERKQSLLALEEATL